MARPRKNAPKPNTQELTLVPVEEQPYPLPEGWKWVRLGSIAEVITGGTPSKKHPEYYGGDFPFFKPSDLDAGRHVFSASEYLTQEGKRLCRVIPADSIGICCIGTIGKSGYFDIECTTNQQINSAIPLCNKLFFYFYTKTLTFSHELLQKASATTIAIVNKTKLESCAFPLPPLDEQERIVTRIESLFAKLDEAKEKAEAVLDSYETRKAAILHKAFTGELTEKWREERGIEKESWNEKLLSDVLDVRDGTHDSPLFYEEGYPLLTSKNLKEGKITFSDFKYISKEDYIKINTRSKVDVYDILFAMIGTIGNPVVVTEEPIFAIKNMALLKYINKINPFYCKYYLETKNVRQKMQNEAKGTTQKFVTLGYLRKFPIIVPPTEEQQEITRILDNLLEKEQQSKEAAETVLEQIDLMKKAILAKAFRGELG